MPLRRPEDYCFPCLGNKAGALLVTLAGHGVTAVVKVGEVIEGKPVVLGE